MNIEARVSQLVKIDDDKDCVFIAGTRVSGDLFRMLATPTPSGLWFRIVEVGDTITIETKREPQT